MSFAFNFSIDNDLPAATNQEALHDDGTGVCIPDEAHSNGRDNSSRNKNKNAADTNHHRDIREPFVWMETSTLQSWLEQACAQELTCREIRLDGSNSKPPRGLDDDGDDAVVANQTGTQQHILRWVVDDDDDDSVDDDEDGHHLASSSNANHKIVTPGIYEGGLQVWECSLDLVRYLHQCLSIIAPNNDPETDEPSFHPSAQLEDATFLQSLLFSSLLLDKDNKYPEMETTTTKTTMQRRRKRILELGCGHALPSIYLLRQWWYFAAFAGLESSSSSSFTKFTNTKPPKFAVCDYNANVLPTVVVPNLVLNVLNAILHETPNPVRTKGLNNKHGEDADDPQKQQSAWSVEQSARLVSQMVDCGTGDWLGLLPPMPSSSSTAQQEEQQQTKRMDEDNNNNNDDYDEDEDEYYDLILAAETLYTPETVQETCRLIAQLLRPETGVAWVATKRYYFGTGGGSELLRQQVADTTTRTTNNDNDNSSSSEGLDITVVQVYDNGVSNIRELLRIQKRRQ